MEDYDYDDWENEEDEEDTYIDVPDGEDANRGLADRSGGDYAEDRLVVDILVVLLLALFVDISSVGITFDDSVSLCVFSFIMIFW